MATDFISREAMHKANQDEWQGVYGFVDCDIFEDNEDMIDRVPAADVQPVVRGKWIDGKCDQCGEHAPYWCMASTYHTTNFCPNCGADMRKVQEDG